MKNKIFNKRNIIVSSLVLLVILAFVVMYFVDLAKFNSNLTKIDGKYVIKVSHLIVDKDEVDEDTTISEITKNKTDSIIYFVDQMVPLTKDGDYLYADLSKYTNELILKNVGDVVYTYNNVYGEKIDGCSYDKKTKILKIPFSYYEDKNREEFVPIQTELVSLITKTESRNIKTNYNIKKFITQSGKASNEALSLDTKISLSDYANDNLSINGIKAYINGSDLSVPKEQMEYDSKTKILTIKYSSVLISRLDIKIDNLIFNNASAYEVSSDYGDDWTTWPLSEVPSSLPSSWSTYSDQLGHGEINHCSWNDDDPASCIGDLGWNEYDWQYFVFEDGNYHSRENGYGRYPFWARAGFVGHNDTTEILKFVDDDDYINLKCIGHADSFNMETGDYISLDIDRVAYDATNRWAVLRITMDGGAYGQTGQAYIKITWPQESVPETCSITPNKSIVSNNTENIYGTAIIGLYEDSDCKASSLKSSFPVDVYGGHTSPMGSFGGLDKDKTYYIKEREFRTADLSNLPNGIVFDSCSNCENTSVTNNTSKCFYNPSITSHSSGKPVCFSTKILNSLPYALQGSPNPTLNIYEEDYFQEGAQLSLNNTLGSQFTPNSACKPVTCTGTSATGSITNTEVEKYCYSIVKKDKGTNADVTGTTWTLVGANNVSYPGTVRGATVTWTELPKQNYTLKETSSPDGYWNEFENGITVSQNELTSGNTCTPVEKKDTKKHYCLKVKKVDHSTGQVVNGAEFEAKNSSLTINKNSGANYYNSSNGIVSFFIEDPSNAGNFNVTETKAPDGYEKDNTTHTLSAILLSKEYTTVAAARQACFSNGNTSDGSTMNAKTIDSNNGNNNFVFKDKKYLINWYKTTENGTTKVDGAEFRVKASNGKFITVSNAPESITDASGVTRACYKYNGEANTGTVMISGDKGATTIDMTGQVCVSGLPSGTYQVIEIKAPEYHTFGSGSTKSITTATSFNNIADNNKLVNYPTEFKFKKKVTDVDGTQNGNTKYTVTIGGVTKNVSLSEMTTEELMKIGFSIYDSNGNVVSVKEVSSGHYEYASNSIDQAGSGNNVTVLHLDSNREIDVKHLPKGSYTIKEVDTSSCQLDNGGFDVVDNPTIRPSYAPSCSGGGTSTGNCIGFYSPDYSTNTYSFTIDDCSSAAAEQNTGSCSTTGGIELQELTNIPTEIILTKKDLYSYSDQADIIDNNREQNSTESNVEFENAKERSDFDRIDFKVKDSNGNYLNFVYVGNTSNTCTSDSDYSVYRYVPGLELPSGVNPNVFNYHAGTDGITITQTLHACGGHIKLINLCRGETYTFEEIKVPDDSVYVLEKEGELNPSACFEVPCSTDESEHRTSTTAVINDKPTRVTFEKKDSKYNYLIDDNTTTFEVYRCPKGTLCSPSSYGTLAEREAAGMKLIKFESPSVIANDQEDPGLKVYRMMSDSDAANKSVCQENQTSNCYQTSVHPDGGRLVLRYLQSGYNYVLLETVAPKGYMLPIGKSAETSFEVINTTVDVRQIDIPNKPTAIIIRKYMDKDGDNKADNGSLLGGAKFRVYKVINYDANKAIKDQEKEIVRLKTIKDGIYENKPVLDTDIITTCSGENCSYTPSSLGYESSDLENIDDLIEKSGNDVTSVLKEGTAIIQYLDYDSYYIIEEVEAPVGYSLPEKNDNRFTLVHISSSGTTIQDTGDALVNKPTSFTFYKFDEYNTPLDGATFYLQKLDNEKNYNTLTVKQETLEDGSIIYRADETSELKDITTLGGKATVYYLEPGQYRILEVAAPEGYELPKKTINVATFFVDNDGLVYGSNIITNKKPAETFEYLASAKSELVVNIQTGKVVIKYGLIITLLIGAIVGLIVFLKKRK